MKKKISIVVPVYNEEKNILPLIASIDKIMMQLPYIYEIVFIDDGSNDNTTKIIQEIAGNNKYIFYISFSRNFGKQSAIKAGVDYCKGDAVVFLDGDMQHPPHLINEMVQKWEEGYDIIYAKRLQNKTAAWWKRIVGGIFYTSIKKISDVPLEKGITDFSLINIRVASIISQLNERDLFFVGLIKWLGFKQYAIPFDAHKRLTGESKFKFKQLLQLALRGVTSFSTKPLYLAIYLGFFFSGISILYLPYALYSYIAGYAISGWTSIIMTIAFLGGLQLLILGVLGVYIGKILMQVKRRPNYIVDKTNIL